jgi:hypothetical protein
LMICVLNVSKKMAALANQIQPATQDITSGSHFGRIDIRLRNHAAAQQNCNLMSIDAIVFGFASMDGFHIESVAEDEGDILIGAKIGEPIPGEEAFDANDDVAAEWLNGGEELIRIGFDVFFETDFSGLIENAEKHSTGKEINTAIKLVLFGVESHFKGPPA